MNCRLPVELVTLTGTITAPAAAVPFPDAVQIARFVAPIRYGLVNWFFSSAITPPAASLDVVYLALNDEPRIRISRAVGVIDHQIGRGLGGVVTVAAENFASFTENAIVIPQGRAISLYASYTAIADLIAANVNLQLVPIE